MAREKRPAFLFYPKDWRNDPELSKCSKAAKGMWIDCLCLLSECRERGVFASSSGLPWSEEQIARAIGGDIAENLSLLHELLSNGVARIDKRNAIFSARMTRDEKTSKEKQRFGLMGGNPALLKQQLNHKHKLNTANANAIENEFEKLWENYPEKDGKKQAFQSFKSTVKTEEDLVLIEKALANYLESVRLKRSSGFNLRYKNGDTWFNNWRDWIDWKPSAPVNEKEPLGEEFLAHMEQVSGGKGK
jgi:hypothetical protein